METLKTTPSALYLEGYAIMVASREAKGKPTGQGETWHRMGTSLCLQRASTEGPEGGVDSLAFCFSCVELAVFSAKPTLVCTRRGEAGSMQGALIDICAPIWHGNCCGPTWEGACICQAPSHIWNHLNRSLYFFFSLVSFYSYDDKLTDMNMGEESNKEF